MALDTATSEVVGRDEVVLDQRGRGVVRWGELLLFPRRNSIAAGAFTLVAVLGVLVDIPIVLPFIGLVMTGAWQLIVGAKLYRMVMPPSSADSYRSVDAERKHDELRQDKRITGGSAGC